MQLPKNITLIESSYMLDGGTTTLFGVTDSGVETSICLSQYMFECSNPGRLYFNKQLVELRSDEEAKIINLLKNASIASKDCSPESPENQISSNALILDDKIKEVIESSPEENLRNLCNYIVTFVESDKYIQIADHGIPKRPSR